MLDTKKFFIGIDPGISGAITCVDSSGNIVNKTIMPVIKIGTKNKLDPHSIIKWIKEITSTGTIQIVAIEAQHAMHKQGVTSTFSTGRGYGILEGVVAGLGLPYELIRAVDWQKVMFQGYPKGKTKELSMRIAQQLYPQENFKKSERCVNIHDGLTDATLIAEYIRRKIK